MSPTRKKEEKRQALVRLVVENISRTTGHEPKVITVPMVGTKAVNDFMKMMREAQKPDKKLGSLMIKSKA